MMSCRFHSVGGWAAAPLSLWVLFCMPSAIYGQFYGQFLNTSLATTDDGATLYFVRQANPIPYVPSKMFIADANGVRVYADKIPDFPYYYTQYVDPPAVSADGSVVAYGGHYGYIATTNIFSWSWVYVYKTLIGIRGSPPTTVNLGGAHLSANGRYAVFTDPCYPIISNLTTGRPVYITGFPDCAHSEGQSIVASDGTVLL